MGINSVTKDPVKAGTVKQDVGADIRTALQLFRDGAVAQGLALYRQILLTENNAHLLPVPLHLTFLQSLNLPQAAAEIEDWAVQAGSDICLSARLNAPAKRQIPEYRKLFARGLVNANMMAGYLEALSRAGELQEMAELLDPAKGLRITSLSAPGFVGDWAGLTDALLALKSENTWREAEMSVRKMHTIKGLTKSTNPLIQGLLAAIRHHVTDIIAHMNAENTGDDRMIDQWSQEDWQLFTWAIISEGGDGHNIRHTHPRGWLTGVVYIACEGCAGPDSADSSEAGALKIGAPLKRIGKPGWPDITIHPKPGLMVLMPSYFTHWTVPLNRPGLRIAVAFDILQRFD